MIQMTLAQASEVLDGVLRGEDRQFVGVSTDTRSLASDAVFFALKGPRFDGHEMLEQAREKGAVGAVVSRPVAIPFPQIVVPETRSSLGILARAWRQKFPIPVIAVTGSAGKTTVKEMIGAIVGRTHNALVGAGNFNNDIGLPQNLFLLSSEHSMAVLEMGANRGGDIAHLCSVALPEIAVLTLCAPAHLEGFGDLDSVARAKGEIVTSLPEHGTAVLNSDDPYFDLWMEMAGSRAVLPFGSRGRVRAENVTLSASGVKFTLCVDEARAQIRLSHSGQHNVANALAAAAAATAAGISLPDIAAGLAAAAPVNGRLQERRGVHGALLIDDTYNANPASLKAALAVLGLRDGARWLVFGDMRELGDAAEAFHLAAGEDAEAAGVEQIFSLGELAAHAAAGFSGTFHRCANADELIGRLTEALNTAESPPTVLLKGSRSMFLDRVADAIALEGRPC